MSSLTLTRLDPFIRRTFFRTLSTTCHLNAGHNKVCYRCFAFHILYHEEALVFQWSKIKHKKGAEDAKKSAAYAKASRVSPCIELYDVNRAHGISTGHHRRSSEYGSPLLQNDRSD
jgi:hypothetical protein